MGKKEEKPFTRPPHRGPQADGKWCNEKRSTHLMDAESATLGKLMERVVEGGRSFPFPPVDSSPVGRET